jgi:hypothetical protein
MRKVSSVIIVEVQNIIEKKTVGNMNVKCATLALLYKVAP